MASVEMVGSNRVMRQLSERLTNEGVSWGYLGGRRRIVARMSRSQAKRIVREKMGYKPKTVAIKRSSL